MRKILYILSPQRESQEALDWVFDQAQSDQSEIDFLYIVDKELTSEVEKCLSEKGFVGEKAGNDLTQALHDEYMKRGEEKIQELIESSKKKDIKSYGKVENGNYLDICQSYLKDKDLVVIINKRRSFIGKLILKSESEELKSVFNKEIKSFESQ